MKYIVTFEVEAGDCELYKNIDNNDCEAACKTCVLKDSNYCMDLNMHNAKVINAELEDGSNMLVTKQFLYDWYQSSVNNDNPIWSDEHIEELFKDFYLIKK